MTSIVFCDNEGCLTPGKGRPFDLPAMMDLTCFLQANEAISLLLCTGRSMPYCEALLQSIGLQNLDGPVICEGGASLFWPRTERFELLGGEIPRETLLGAMPAGAFREELGKKGTLSLYPEPGYTVSALYEIVRPFVAKHEVPVEVRTSAAAVDITPRGIDKGTAIRRVGEILGFDPSEAYAIGDSDNDLPMLATVGTAACPANATDAVRDRCHYVSLREATAGVVDILEKVASGELRPR